MGLVQYFTNGNRGGPSTPTFFFTKWYLWVIGPTPWAYFSPTIFFILTAQIFGSDPPKKHQTDIRPFIMLGGGSANVSYLFLLVAFPALIFPGCPQSDTQDEQVENDDRDDPSNVDHLVEVISEPLLKSTQILESVVENKIGCESTSSV